MRDVEWVSVNPRVGHDAPMPAAPFALEPLLTEVRARSTGIGSDVHGELHWRTVGANGPWIADALAGVDTHVAAEPPGWLDLYVRL